MAHEDMMDAVHASLDARLPDGFVADINELHWELRKASGGKVALHEILDALRSFIKYEGDFDRDAKPKLEAVFQVVDVIEDGMLNRNEMDLFHFIVRESMVNAALKFGHDLCLIGVGVRQHCGFERCGCLGWAASNMVASEGQLGGFNLWVHTCCNRRVACPGPC